MKEDDEAVTFAFDEIVWCTFIVRSTSGSMNVYESSNEVLFVGADYETVESLLIPTDFTDMFD